ncbi:MAG: tetratricopeptide repeat protein [Candidatus Hodarchaeota archaeon]
MSDSTQKELTHLEELIHEGKFDEALQFVRYIEENEKITPIHRFTCAIFKNIIFIKKGLYKEALKSLEMILQENNNMRNTLQGVKAFIAMAEALQCLGKLNESLNAIKEGERIVRTCKHEFPTNDLQRKNASLLYRKGCVMQKKGDLDQAMNYHSQGLTIRERIGNKYDIAASLNSIGMIYDLMGDWDRALEYYQRSLTLRNEVGNKQEIAMSLNNIGVVYLLKGQMNQALDLYEQSLALFKQLGSKQYIAGSLTNIGIIHRVKGNLDLALDYYTQSLDIRREIGDKQEIARLFNNMGAIYADKGDWNQGLEYYKQCLIIQEQIGNNHKISITLLQYISLIAAIMASEERQSLNDQNLLDQASFNLNKFQIIHEKTNSKIISQHYRLAKAIVMKMSENLDDKIKAQNLFQQIIRGGSLEFEQQIFAMINLCYILFEIFILSGEQSYLLDLRNQLDMILDLAKQNHLHMVKLQILFLIGKLDIIQMKLENARSLLKKAKSEAHNRGYDLIEQHCDNEISKLQKYKKIDTILEIQESERINLQKKQTQDFFDYLKAVAIHLSDLDM